MLVRLYAFELNTPLQQAANDFNVFLIKRKRTNCTNSNVVTAVNNYCTVKVYIEVWLTKLIRMHTTMVEHRWKCMGMVNPLVGSNMSDCPQAYIRVNVSFKSVLMTHYCARVVEHRLHRINLMLLLTAVII